MFFFFVTLTFIYIYVPRNKQNLWTPHCASLRHLTPAPVPPRFETGAYRLGLPWARGPAAIVISGQLMHLECIWGS